MSSYFQRIHEEIALRRQLRQLRDELHDTRCHLAKAKIATSELRQQLEAERAKVSHLQAIVDEANAVIGEVRCGWIMRQEIPEFDERCKALAALQAPEEEA